MISVPAEQSTTSKAISLLRFPLIILVVALHISLSGDVNFSSVPVAREVIEFCRKFANAAVPLFFVFSGFFFFKEHELSVPAYRKKIAVRIKTLLIPFLFWNFLWIVCAFIALKLELETSRNPWNTLEAGTWIRGFFGFISPSGLPFLESMWFIRDLFFAALLAPAYYFVAKRIGFFALIIIGGLWISGWETGVPGFSSKCIFFFLTGTVLAVNKIDFAALCAKFCAPACVALIAMVSWTTAVAGTITTTRFARIELLIAMIAIVGIAGKIASRKVEKIDDPINNKVAQYFSSATFFVFCAHMFFTSALSFFYPNINFNSSWKVLAVYFSSIITATMLSLFLFEILRRTFPKGLEVLNGRRIISAAEKK